MTASRRRAAQQGVTSLADALRDGLVEAELLARYAWAAQLARGRSVLVAGCGLSRGASLLSAAGARDVVAVDSEEVLEAAGAGAGSGVRLQAAALSQLPFADASFDVVLCLEALDRGDEIDVVLGELARVVDAAGLLIVSLPAEQPTAEAARAPHPRLPGVIEQLRERFAQVVVAQQHDWLASSVLVELPPDAPGSANPQLARLPLADEPGEVRHVVVLAGDELPEELPGGGALSRSVELDRWLALLDERERRARRHEERAEELERAERERDELAELLLEGEQELARIPLMERRMDELQLDHEVQRTQLERDLEDLRRRLTRAEGVIDAMRTSASWRLTAPLRALKRFGRRIAKRRA